MNEVTRILSAITSGEPRAAEQLLPLVYDELRRLAAQKLARERPGQTLQATALVHEAWLRLEHEGRQHWNDSKHFFCVAAQAMRRILVENARRKQSARNGGHLRRVDGEPLDLAAPLPDDVLLAVDEALGRLGAVDARAAEVGEFVWFFRLKRLERHLEPKKELNYENNPTGNPLAERQLGAIELLG